MTTSMLSDKPMIVTVSGWIVAPDGEQYRAVWGRVTVVNWKSLMDVSPGGGQANFALVVENGGEKVIVAGCQVQYLVECPERPRPKAVPAGQLRNDVMGIYIPGAVRRAQEQTDEI